MDDLSKRLIRNVLSKVEEIRTGHLERITKIQLDVKDVRPEKPAINFKVYYRTIPSNPSEHRLYEFILPQNSCPRTHQEQINKLEDIAMNAWTYFQSTDINCELFHHPDYLKS